MITIDKILDLKTRLEALKGHLDVEEKRGQILEEEKYAHDPDFWNDQKKAQVVMKKIRERSARVTAKLAAGSEFNMSPKNRQLLSPWAQS